MVTPSPAIGRRLANDLISRTSMVYDLSLEAISQSEVDFLDLSIFRRGHSRSLCFRPFVKPTARHIPLASHSEHPWRVHASWPIAEMARMRSRSMLTADFVRFSRLKLARFAETFLDRGIIQACKRWRSDCPSNKFMRSVSNSSRVRKIYLSAPWHLKAGKTLIANVSAWNRVFAAAFRRQYGIQLRLEVS